MIVRFDMPVYSADAIRKPPIFNPIEQSSPNLLSSEFRQNKQFFHFNLSPMIASRITDRDEDRSGCQSHGDTISAPCDRQLVRCA